MADEIRMLQTPQEAFEHGYQYGIQKAKEGVPNYFQNVPMEPEAIGRFISEAIGSVGKTKHTVLGAEILAIMNAPIERAWRDGFSAGHTAESHRKSHLPK